MTQQLELPLKAARERANADAETLVSFIRERSVRIGAARVDAQVLGWKERRIRAAAEASKGRVLSAPGIFGYRLAADTSVASYYATERARYLSQIHHMQERLTAMDRAVHAAGAQ